MRALWEKLAEVRVESESWPGHQRGHQRPSAPEGGGRFSGGRLSLG